LLTRYSREAGADLLSLSNDFNEFLQRTSDSPH